MVLFSVARYVLCRVGGSGEMFAKMIKIKASKIVFMEFDDLEHG